MTLKALILTTGLILGMSALPAGAESITLTTYYPSPSGNYQNLSISGNMGVGTTTPVEKLEVKGNLKANTLALNTTTPNRVGDLGLQPQSGDPATWTVGNQGQVAYSADNDQIYYSNGSAWVAQSSGQSIINISCSWGCIGALGFYSNSVPACMADGVVPSCTAPSCPSGWTSIATFSEITSVSPSNYESADNIAGKTVRVCTK